MSKHEIEYLTAAQVVERSGRAFTTGTLANRRTQGKGPPFVKFGTRVRYPLPDLIEWEFKNKHAANDNTP